MDGLYLSCLLHVIHTVFSFVRVRKFTVHNIISLWFSIVVIIGIISVQNDIYQAVHGEVYDLPYAPYIYEFIAFLIFIWPFKYLDNNYHITGMPNTNKRLNIIIYFLLFLFIIYLLLLLKIAFFVTQFSLVDSYYSLTETGETLYKYSWVEEKISWICGSAYKWFAPLLVIYAIYLMIKDNTGRYVFKSKVYLLIIFACEFLSNISRGGRGGTFWFIILMILVILPFFKQFSKHSKKALLKIAPIIIGISLIYAVMMSILRTEYSRSENSFTQVVRYLGEPFPHLANAFWEHVKQHPMGARMMPMLIGGTQYEESYGYVDVWGFKMDVPIQNYPTMYGDFYCEFGKNGALIAILIMSLLFYLFVRKNPYSFSKYPIIYLYLKIAVTAPFWFGQRGNAGIKVFLAALIIYIIVEFSNNRKYKC